MYEREIECRLRLTTAGWRLPSLLLPLLLRNCDGPIYVWNYFNSRRPKFIEIFVTNYSGRNVTRIPGRTSMLALVQPANAAHSLFIFFFASSFQRANSSQQFHSCERSWLMSADCERWIRAHPEMAAAKNIMRNLYIIFFCRNGKYARLSN